MRATLALLLLLATPASARVSLDASSVTVGHAGESGQVCVSLATDGKEVAGTQNDLVWDGNCATLSDASQCAVAGTHGKMLSGKLIPRVDFTYRALILSLTDVDPIEGDGVLYCCSFVAEGPPGSCCPIEVVNHQASDSSGNAVSTVSTGGQVCIDSGAIAVPSPTPGSVAGSEDDGCAIVPDARGRGLFPLLGALALGLLARRRSRRR